LKRDVTVCFSGGLDSTWVAYTVGKEWGGNVHLFTMVPYANLFPHWADKHASDLKRLLGEDRVHHHYEDTRALFHEVVVGKFFQEWAKYKSHFVWCLGCHCAMVAKVIIYNLEHQIPYVMFASSVGGQYAVMSMPVTHKNWREFYGEYGIDFQAPLIDRHVTKADERKDLSELGIWIGMRFNRAVLGVQPLCIPGWHHIMDILFNVHTNYDPVQVNRFFQDKRPVLMKHIEETLKARGKDVNELVAGLKRKHEEWARHKSEPAAEPAAT